MGIVEDEGDKEEERNGEEGMESGVGKVEEIPDGDGDGDGEEVIMELEEEKEEFVTVEEGNTG